MGGFNHPPLQQGWIDRPHQTLNLGRFVLESGAAIEDFALSYVVHGTADAARSNVILGLTAIGSSHHRLDFLIGPGKPLDTDRLCIVVADAIGNGLTTSPSTSTAQAGTAFPRFTIRDMVASQMALVDHLGIERLHTVIGASMGGMQALQWAVSHPQRMARVAALVPMAQTTAWSVAVNEASRRALMADPEWETGPAARGWHAWTAIMQALAARTPEAMRAACPSPRDAVAWIEARARAQAEGGMRAVDWIYQTYAYDAHDVAATPGHGGDLARALGSIAARTLILAAPDDLYNPTREARAAAALIPGARYVEVPSIMGHQAASGALAGDVAFIARVLRAFLD